MSQHRQHYFEANFFPDEPATTGMESAPVRIAAIALVVCALCAALTPFLRGAAAEEPVVTPVRTPEIVHYELPPLDVAQARIEGFRAGYAEAMAQGCRLVLSSPVTR